MWSGQQIHANLDLLRLPNIFTKRHDMGFFFFFGQVYIPTYAKRILHKKHFRKALWWVTPWLNSFEETPSEVFISECGLWARNGAWQSPVQISERKGSPAPLIFHSTKCSSSFIKAVGKSCRFFIASTKWKKKKSSEKQSFILFGRYGQLLPPNFPGVVYVITWCNSLLKEADIMYVSTYSLHILEWRWSSHVWTSPFSGALAWEEQELPGFTLLQSCKTQTFFFLISLF